MTSIDRTKFVTDLSAASFSSKTPPDAIKTALRDAGVDPATLDAIARGDHVVNGQSEVEALYQKLVDLEAQRAASGKPDNIDRVQVVYNAIKASMGPQTPQTGAPGPLPVAGSGRTPATGIFAPAFAPFAPALAPLAPLVPALPRSSAVQARGDAAASPYQAAAAKNVTGPEAQYVRGIEALTKSAVDDIHALEAKAAALPAGSAERQAIEAQIAAREAEFDQKLDGLKIFAPLPKDTPTSPVDSVVRALPPYLRDSLGREGVVIPGAPGAIAPRFSKPAGIDWRIKF